MKSLNCIAFALLSTCLFISCKPQPSIEKTGGVTFYLESAKGQLQPNEVKDVMGILERRFEKFEESGVAFSGTFDQETQQFIISLAGAKEASTYRNVITSQANLIIAESFDAPEIFNHLSSVNQLMLDEDNLGLFVTDKADTLAMSSPLFSLLTPPVDLRGQLDNSPLMGYALPEDTPTINRIFKHQKVKELMPDEFLPYWSQKALGGRLQLYATKANSGLKGQIVESTRIAYLFQSDRLQLVIQLKPRFHQEWEEITEKNIDKALPIIINGKVYSAPKVAAPIEGGALSIVGFESEEEAGSIGALIESPQLPVRLIIVSEEIVGPSL